jgi:hypothetical protein
MTVEEICRLLSTGWVESRDVPELMDDDVRADVARRGEAVGQRLYYSEVTDHYGFVLAGELPEAPSHRPAVRLDRSHRAVIAACWMHLRWLPAERQRVGAESGPQAVGPEEPCLTIDELALQFRGQLTKGHIEWKLVPHLKHTGYLVQREKKLYGGPMLDSLDELKATELAREYMARYKRMAHLKRRAEAIDQIRKSTEEATRAAD